MNAVMSILAGKMFHYLWFNNGNRSCSSAASDAGQEALRVGLRFWQEAASVSFFLLSSYALSVLSSVPHLLDHPPPLTSSPSPLFSVYAPPESDRLTPSPTESQQLLAGSCYAPGYLSEQYMSPLSQNRFYGREAVGLGQQHKDPSSSPSSHSRWYLPPQQAVPPNRLDFPSSYEGDFSGNTFYKPFPLQTSAHHHHHPLGYYPDHPFATTSMSVSGVTSVGWATSRPTPQYLSHPSKNLSWFRPISSTSPSSSSSTSPGHPRLHPTSMLEPLQASLLPDKPKDSTEAVGEDPWHEPTSVKSATSGDSGLFEGSMGENKKRRVSPYTSSTENSPLPPRSGEACEKDTSSDADYYGYYTH